MAIETIHDLLIAEIHSLYSAEQELLRALPRLEMAAHNRALRTLFAERREETTEQVQRLEKVFDTMQLERGMKRSAPMASLVHESDQAIGTPMPEDVKDLALAAVAQSFEALQIAAYCSAQSLAMTLGLIEVAALLENSLVEEERADVELAKISASILIAVGTPLEV